jgi:hypothetical protein
MNTTLLSTDSKVFIAVSDVKVSISAPMGLFRLPVDAETSLITIISKFPYLDNGNLFMVMMALRRKLHYWELIKNANVLLSSWKWLFEVMQQCNEVWKEPVVGIYFCNARKMLLWKVGTLLPDFTVSHPKNKRPAFQSHLWTPGNLTWKYYKSINLSLLFGDVYQFSVPLRLVETFLLFRDIWTELAFLSFDFV